MTKTPDCLRAGEDSDREVLAIRDNLGRIRAQFDAATDCTTLFLPESEEIGVRIVNGKLEISCPAGLRFITPGVIEFTAGQGVRMAAEKSSIDLAPESIKIATNNLGLAAEGVSLSGGTMKARLERLTITVGKLEQFAGRVVQQARCVYQQIETLLHTRAGRIRVEAVASHLTQAESIRVVADEDVRIQANSINLG